MEPTPAISTIKTSSPKKYLLPALGVVCIFLTSVFIGYFFLRDFSIENLLKREGEDYVGNINFKAEDYKKSFVEEKEKSVFILGAIKSVEEPYFTVDVDGEEIRCRTDVDTELQFLTVLGESKGASESAEFSDLKEGDQVGVFCYKGEGERCSSVAGATIFRE